MANPRDVRAVTASFGPINRFFLRAESAEDMIGMIFSDIIDDRASFLAAFGASFNIDDSHRSFLEKS